MSHCRVHLLDESQIEIGVNLHAIGRELLQSVCKYLNVVEVDYFGLKYKGKPYDDVWVRLDKPIKKQFPTHPENWEFTFAVKFYPTDPVYLKEEITKYQLCLQIRDDLMNGRLQCPLDILITLSSYWLQSEFGDNQQQSGSDVKRYLTSLRYISGEDTSTPEFDEKVEKLYKARKGMPPEDADTQFLRLASSLPYYGLHRYTTEMKDVGEMVVGVGSVGVVEIRDKEKPVKHRWNSIKNINFKKEKFYVKLLAKDSGDTVKKTYFLKSSFLAKAMWWDAVDQHVFFRVTCSDTSSAGRTPMSTPKPKKNKDISKKKRKLSFRLSFQKKRPKTEMEVREESSKIKRPNPTVVRHSSLKRSASGRSKRSSQSDSFESSTSYYENEEEKTRSGSPLKSILKNTTDTDGVPQSEDVSEDSGRSFTNEDFTEESLEKEDSDADNNLLLTQTILEEDEDMVNAEKSPTTPDSAFAKSMDAETHLESPPKSMNHGIEVVISEPVEENNNQHISCPIVTVEVCEEPRKLSVDLHPRSSESKFLPPPLLTQSTKDAILPYCLQENENRNNNPQTTKPDSKTTPNFQEQTEVKVVVVDANEVSETPPQHKSSLSEELSSITESQISRSGEKDDDEDDRKTVGAFSAVAVLGDDDPTIKDLTDDVDLSESFDFGEKHYEMQVSLEDNGSRIPESSESSISNLTDNTEELCNPNILEIIWSKCTAGRGYDYREIFGVKLRKVKGRQRNAKSIVDLDQPHSIGIQVPSPPSSTTPKLNKEQPKFSYFSNGRKFIPSWPFDPESLAVTVELDELDKEAIKAALLAQKELKKDLEELEDTSLQNDLVPDVSQPHTVKDTIFEENEAEENISDYPDRKRSDSIPGIPEFHKSVFKSVSTSSNGSRQESPQLEVQAKSFSVFPASTVNNPSSELNPNFSAQSKLRINHLPASEKESLSFPPNIFTYSSTADHEKNLLEYKPEAKPKKKHETTKNDNLKAKTNLEEYKPIINTQLQNFESKNDVDSGRSTPSSVSSFPPFVHSVYPLRKMSTNWGSEVSEATEIQQDNTSERLETASEEDEFMTHQTSKGVTEKVALSKTNPENTEEVNGSLEAKKPSNSSSASDPVSSKCSIKSVKGSSDGNSCNMDDEYKQENLTESMSTELTVIEFITDSVFPVMNETSISADGLVNKEKSLESDASTNASQGEQSNTSVYGSSPTSLVEDILNDLEETTSEEHRLIPQSSASDSDSSAAKIENLSINLSEIASKDEDVVPNGTAVDILLSSRTPMPDQVQPDEQTSLKSKREGGQARVTDDEGQSSANTSNQTILLDEIYPLLDMSSDQSDHVEVAIKRYVSSLDHITDRSLRIDKAVEKESWTKGLSKNERMNDAEDEVISISTDSEETYEYEFSLPPDSAKAKSDDDADSEET